MTDQFFTVRELAEYLRVCENTVRSRLARGEIEHYRIGNQIRIPQRSVDQYLESIKRGNEPTREKSPRRWSYQTRNRNLPFGELNEEAMTRDCRKRAKP